jgi:hypothetical protein
MEEGASEKDENILNTVDRQMVVKQSAISTSYVPGAGGKS